MCFLSKKHLATTVPQNHWDTLQNTKQSLFPEYLKVHRSKMGKDHLGADQRKVIFLPKSSFFNMYDQVKEVDEEEKEIKALDEKDIALLKSYGQGQYTKALKVSRGTATMSSQDNPQRILSNLPFRLWKQTL